MLVLGTYQHFNKTHLQAQILHPHAWDSHRETPRGGQKSQAATKKGGSFPADGPGGDCASSPPPCSQNLYSQLTPFKDKGIGGFFLFFVLEGNGKITTNHISTVGSDSWRQTSLLKRRHTHTQTPQLCHHTAQNKPHFGPGSPGLLENQLSTAS